MTIEQHFKRLELMTKKYSGGEFVTDVNGDRSYQIAQLDPDDEANLAQLDALLADSTVVSVECGT